VLPWTLFAGAITLAVPSLVDNLNMVTKIYFPREILPLSAIGVALVDFLVASMVFVGLVIAYRVPASATWLWVPLLLGIQLLLMAGIVLIASAVIVFYRDVRFIVGLGMQLWMYATPIIYPITLIPERFRSLYMFNPMVGLIDSYRRVILYSEPPSPYLLISALIAVGIFIIGYWFFKNTDWKFADVI
jgi:lipopolysaccharide transport system permease protein